MVISKATKLAKRWASEENNPHGDSYYAVLDFIGFLYMNGFTIDSRYINEDAKEQEDLIDSKK